MAADISEETEKSLSLTAVFPGFKFSPTDVELISYYLKGKIEGLETSVEIIPEVEIYNFEPWDLPDKSAVKSDSEWFFFCARGKKYPHGAQNRRATQKGYWKATGKERDVKSGSEVVGTKRTLVFHVGRAPKGERTEWIMHEYCLKEVPPDALVVCRLRRNIELQASSSHKAPDPHLPDNKLAVVQNVSSSQNISEWENMVDYYLSTESGQELINDIAESVQNPKTPIEEDLYADILRDEIVKLDEAVIQGNATNERPMLQNIATTSRVLPLPSMIDSHMGSALQEELFLDKEGNKRNEPVSKCLCGLFWIKTVNRERWCGVLAAVVMVALLMFYFA